MALSDYAVFLACATAALVLYAGAGVASRRDWVRRDYRPMAAVMLLAGLLVQGAAAPKLGQRGGPHASDVEAEAAAGRALPYFTQLAICLPCLVLIACAAVAELRRARMPPPPPQSVPARRYAEAKKGIACYRPRYKTNRRFGTLYFSIWSRRASRVYLVQVTD